MIASQSLCLAQSFQIQNYPLYSILVITLVDYVHPQLLFGQRQLRYQIVTLGWTYKLGSFEDHVLLKGLSATGEH